MCSQAIQTVQNKTNLLIVAILIGTFIPPFGGSAILSIFKALKFTFDISVEYIVFAISAYNFALTATLLFSGALSDIYGRKKVIVYGFILFGIGSIGSALAPNIVIFILFRFINGLGDGLVTPVLFTLLGDLVPEDKRGRYIGFSTTLVLIAWMLGPLVAGYTALISWRYIYVAIFFMVLFVLVIYQTRITYFRKSLEKSLFKALSDNFFSVLKSRLAVVIAILGFLMFFARMSFYTFLADVLTLPPFSFTDDYIGYIFFVNGLAGVILGPITGYIYDSFGRFKTLITGAFVVCIIYLVFVIYSWSAYLIHLMIIYGAAFTILLTALNTLSVEVVPELRGTMISIYFSLCSLGFSMAPLVILPIYLTYGFYMVNLVNLVIMILSIILIVFVFYKKQVTSDW